MIRIVVSLHLIFLALSGPLSAQDKGAFYTAAKGCAMAHCNDRMTNAVRIAPPQAAQTSIFRHDTLSAGKGKGLGCSSNGQFAACSFKDPAGDNLIFYNAQGSRIWSSGSLLDANAYASAPMISQTGDVIAADDFHLVRVDSTGKTVWDSPTPGGIPISPVMTASGAVILATYGGPVSAFDSKTGKLIGALSLSGPSGKTYFDTVNTPCVRGNRIYISMQLENGGSSGSSTGASTGASNGGNNVGALVAMDVDTANPQNALSVAWSFLFGAPGGASPLCSAGAVYFDGAARYPGQTLSPRIFAVQDAGKSASLLWSAAVPGVVPANFGLDPRGGMWAMFMDWNTMERFDALTGQVLEDLDITALVGGAEPNYPYSAITVAGTKTDPVLLLGTTNGSTEAPPTSSHVIAVDLPSRSLLWKVEIAPSHGMDDAPSQFPIVQNAKGNPVVVFAGRSSGAYFVAAPPGTGN